MTDSQLACTYAALALFDDDLEVTSEKIQKILKAANVKVETYWPGLFSQLIAEKGMAALLTGACKGGGGGGGGAAGGATTGGAAAALEEKQEEEPEESEEQESSASGPGLFGGDDSSSDESSS